MPALAETVALHLISVLPVLRRELEHNQARAVLIPSRELRDAALQALSKRGNIEGAALFATLAPRAHRTAATRALAAFQTAYNYLDALSEQPSAQPSLHAANLHRALLAALGADVEHTRFYSLQPGGADDAGFLTSLIVRCRDSCAQLPSFPLLAPLALRAAGRIVEFQSLNLPDADGGQGHLNRWAQARIPPGFDLSWRELAGAAGSSLAVHALLAAAADPALTAGEAREIEACYFPWAGALHSLLDSLVDRAEDRRAGRASLLDGCTSRTLAARLRALAAYARHASATLPQPARHGVILTAMCSYYLSAPECRDAHGTAVRDALLELLGAPFGLALSMFAAKRLLHRLTSGVYR
ncbi:MAG TPA: DUF2600 family protein [Solirubrobacteraceae bacterium]|nr:DUF2600 family protein [Solirubrobacteraceae bacterium]